MVTDGCHDKCLLTSLFDFWSAEDPEINIFYKGK